MLKILWLCCPFLEWLCYHPTLLIISLLQVALLTGAVGAEFGIYHLFWHKESSIQFFAGLGVSLLLGEVCLVGYLLHLKRVYPNPPLWSLRWYFYLTFLPLLALCGLPALARIQSYNPAVNPPEHKLFDLAGTPPKRRPCPEVALAAAVPFQAALHLAFAENAADGGGEADKLTRRVGLVWAIDRRWVFLVGNLVGCGLVFGLLWWYRTNLYRATKPAEPAQPPSRPPSGTVQPPEPSVGPPTATTETSGLPGDGGGNGRRRDAGGGGGGGGSGGGAALPALAAPPARTFFLVLAGLAAVLFLFSFFPPPLGGQLEPGLGICVLLGLATAVYGFLTFHFPGGVFPGVLALLALAVICSWKTHKHWLPELESYYEKPSATSSNDLSVYETTRQNKVGLDDRAVLKAWADNNKDQPQPQLVIVCASGGGIAASLWTGVVLAALEKNIPHFHRRVRLLTGASGGMVGSAYYAARMEDINNLPEGGVAAVLDSMVHNLGKDCLKQVGRQAVLRDVPAIFLWPCHYEQDRGLALEDAWKENLEGALHVPLASLEKGEEEGWRPSLIFSPMLVEDGRQLLISNLDLDKLVETRGPLGSGTEDQPAGRQREPILSVPAVEFARLFPRARDRFRLSTAVRMNASFPYVAPVSTIPTLPARRFIDAGYYDNFGIRVALAWLYRNRHDLPRYAPGGVVLIQIRAYANQTARSTWMRKGEHDSGGVARGLEGLSTPLEGVLQVRSSSQMFRNDEQIRLLGHLLDDAYRSKFPSRRHSLKTVIFECPVEASLSWYLTDDEITGIRDGVPAVSRHLLDLPPNDFQNQQLPKLKNTYQRENAQNLHQLRRLLR
jgi:hypothetical protein